MFLKCYYQNVRGLRSKYNEIYSSMAEANYPSLRLSETWLDDLQTMTFFRIPKQYIEQRDHTLRNVAYIVVVVVVVVVSYLLLIRIISVRRTDLVLLNKVIWVEVPCNGKTNLLVAVV